MKNPPSLMFYMLSNIFYKNFQIIMNYKAALNVLIQDNVISPPEIKFDVIQGSESVWSGTCQFQSKYLRSEGNSKVDVTNKIYGQIYNIIISDGVPASYHLETSGYFLRLLKRKKTKESKIHKEKRTRQFIDRHDDLVPRKCPHCQYEFNYPHWETCKVCKQSLNVVKENIAFVDIERAAGPDNSEPIQIGIVKYDLETNRIVEEKLINIRARQKIDRVAAKFSHGLKMIGKTLVNRNGDRLPTVSPSEAWRMFNSSIENCNKIVCHGNVDFVTLDTWIEMYKFSSTHFLKLERINSMTFFSHVMLKDFGKNKPGMATISLKEYCGNEKTEELYKQGGHGADVDAKVLCLLSTSKRMYNRFFSFFALDKVFGVRRNSYSMRYLPF